MKNGKETRIIDWIMKVPLVDLAPLLARLKGAKRTTLMVVLAALAVPGVLLSLGFVHLVGTQKLYCLNCHINQKDSNFWAKSTVHPDVNCATCHDMQEGGLIYSALHFGFSAKDDLVSERCLGCHKDDVDNAVGVDAAAKDRPDSELVRIPHGRHAGELGIKCTFCHYNVFHERRPAELATFRPKMDVCFSCHDQASTSCDTCHPAGMPKSVASSEDAGGGKVRFFPEGYGPVTFDHGRHLGAGLECGSCHDRLFDLNAGAKPRITMAGIFAGRQCGHCHDGKTAFSSQNCGGCHVGAVVGGELTYNVDGFGPVTFSHDRHLGMGLSCEGCHTGLFGFGKSAGRMTMEQMNKGRYCGGCHNGKKAFAADACDSCHVAG